ncbi:tRNA (adenosine(37)-N6)-dimethylallyltransferase MiaA [Leucothrix pacifica]|uniref:tRNA dimethylallyltransferase n=1 Tax=Leucothrix pacifica TaxID=1247513 RepID=A0A317CMP4_9GAMM|nr:tRNA (adenosine(37)-N6)-dimethylallyltransferase MiaA [Leucothrix pacifica]PWQ99806.1 tRNA (adenosine(37)-N6)-dimethylallyltransferase MiaA [Leucothrix pacifica]
MSSNDTTLPPAIFIMGPTASGKTDLAVDLVDKYPCELISVDSALVFKGMDIGTAKPDEETLRRAPHKLISFLDPSESYSAADFRRDALAEMKTATEAGKVPVLVGGTMLYFRALEQGLADMPDANPEIRAKLTQEAEANGWQSLHDRLAQVDPESAARIHPNDPQRLQRALEVYEVSGVSMTELHKRAAVNAVPYRLLKIALIPSDREWLRKRAELRFDLMTEAGFIDEVKALYERGDLHENLPAIRSVGYRQAWDYLTGKVNYEEMRSRAIIATRQLAKRQLTWLRSEQGITTHDPLNNDTSSILAEIDAFLSAKQG